MRYRYRTIPDMFYKQAETYSNRVWRRYKKDGRWVDITWNEAREQIENFAMGLIRLGIKPKDKVVILSENRNEWYISDLAIQSIGAVVVPIYPTSTSDQIIYILKDLNAAGVILSTKQQYHKIEWKYLKSIGLQYTIIMDNSVPSNESVIRFGHIISFGKTSDLRKELQNRLSNISPNDVATIIYTSGTTGDPKGVMLTHKNIISDIESTYEVFGDSLGEEVIVSFLPISHPFARTVDYYMPMYHGRGVQVLAEGTDKLVDNIAEIKPTMFVSVPRVFEKLYTQIISRTETYKKVKRRIFYWAISIGKHAVPYLIEGKSLPLNLSIKYKIANKLVFEKVRRSFGDRLRFAISGGAPLSKELGEFFFALGVKIIEGYGLTEASPVLTVNPPNRIKFGTVGKPIPGCELRIASDGEILARGPMIMKGYYKDPDATKEAIDENGWLHTGDIGFTDEDGYLHITDRKKDIIVTAGGKNIAPQPIENRLKMNKYIEDAIIIGDRKPYCVALIVPSFEAIIDVAKKKNIPFTVKEELLEDPRIKVIFDEAIADVNKGLARYETIKKFALIPELFTRETGELTPTLKIKRWVIANKYKHVIDQLYEVSGSKLLAQV
ncbi:MAG: AMP-dependent synthetase/ligase [bacterium]